MPSFCKHPDCTGGKNGKPKQALFGKPGEPRTRCKDHKLPDMDSTRKQKECEHPGCPTRPSFGYDGKATHCKKHKQPDMEYTQKRKTCENPECETQPSYGYDGKATHCKKHKLPDMDPTKKTCEHPGCPTQPFFGYDGKATHCSKHKLPNMEPTWNTCEHPECGTSPSYGYDGKATHCSQHKLPDMDPVRTCASDWCDTTVTTDKYDGYCTLCFKYYFPDDPRTPKIRSKTKEDLVREFINEHFEGFKHDEPIVYGGCDCSMRRRVDHRKLIGGTMLAIETDEFQHRSYDARQEEIRYDDLFIGAHSGKWIFIRFNPDGYTDSKGKKRKGMFHANGENNYAEVKRRLVDLKEEMEKQIKRCERDENTELLEIHKLFYDDSVAIKS